MCRWPRSKQHLVVAKRKAVQVAHEAASKAEEAVSKAETHQWDLQAKLHTLFDMVKSNAHHDSMGVEIVPTRWEVRGKATVRTTDLVSGTSPASSYRTNAIKQSWWT